MEKREDNRCILHLINIFKVMGGTLIGIFGIYFGYSLLLIGMIEGFKIFKELENINNIIPGMSVIILSLLVSLNTLGTDQEVKIKQQKKSETEQNQQFMANLLIVIMFGLGIVLAVFYLLSTTH